jgi:hypothetical protein
MTVNEDPWIAKCPKCGNTDPNVQWPITMGTPPQCAECKENPWRERGGYHVIQHYLCMNCKLRYLTPKLEREDTEYIMFGHDG